MAADKTWAELTREQRQLVRGELLCLVRDNELTLRTTTSHRARSDSQWRIEALRAALAALPEVPR